MEVFYALLRDGRSESEARDLIAALAHRQKQIGAELAVHQRGRRAGMAYRNQSDGVPRYVDRSS